MGKPITSVTIVGGGTAGWLSAALLTAYGRRGKSGEPPLQVTLIESPDIPTVGVGEATVPGMVRTLQSIGISERDFFRECNASFKLGVSFDGWNVDAKGRPISYINPFAGVPVVGGIELERYFLHYGAGPLDFVQAYSPTADLVKAARGPRPGAGEDFKSATGFAYHLDAGRFAAMLTRHCTARGVRHLRENVKHVEQDEAGGIAALELSETGRLPVELVLDCTGFRGVIINQVLKEPFLDYSRYLANDRAMAVQIPHPDPRRIEPVTRSAALGAGWSWRVPLYNRVGTGYVFSSAHRSDEEARAEFLSHLGPAGKDAEPRVIPMRVGRNRNAWVRNCVAIGLSGGFIEPLESTAIYMIDMGIRWLLNYFPDSDFPDPLRTRYNRLIDNLYNEVRDFICLHYRLGNRTDTRYWIDAREALEVPDRLAENIELWRYNLPAPYDLPFATLFDYRVYAAVLLGKQVYRTDYAKGDFGAGLPLTEKEWRRLLRQLRDHNAKQVARSMDHRRLLAQLRDDPPPAAAPFPVAAATVPLPGMAAPPRKLRPVPAETADRDASLL